MKVKNVKLGDTITMDVGYGGGPDLQPCTVIDIDRRTGLFGQEEISLTVDYNGSVFDTCGFDPEGNI